MAVNNLPQLWKFDPGDYLSLGATFTKFLSNLNIYTQAIYTILNGNVGFANLQRAIYSTTITAGSTTPMKFVNPLGVAPSGVTVAQVLLKGNTQTALTAAVMVGGWYFDGVNINVLNLTGLTAASTYKIALEIF